MDFVNLSVATRKPLLDHGVCPARTSSQLASDTLRPVDEGPLREVSKFLSFVFNNKMDETYIFHETQEGLLCGQHCLNNLLQQTLFTAVDLSEIAIRLDETEREMLATSDGDAPVGRRSGT